MDTPISMNTKEFIAEHIRLTRPAGASSSENRILVETHKVAEIAMNEFIERQCPETTAEKSEIRLQSHQVYDEKLYFEREVRIITLSTQLLKRTMECNSLASNNKKLK